MMSTNVHRGGADQNSPSGSCYQMAVMVGTVAGGPGPCSVSAADARTSYLITVLGYLVLTRVIAIFPPQGCSED